MFYNKEPGPSHYPAPEGSTPSRIDAIYADPRWVRGVTAGYIVRPEEMQDRKGHCRMMVTVDVKVQGPGEGDGYEQESNEEGVILPAPARWAEEEDVDKRQQGVQQVHVEMRRGSHAHWAMGKAANVCGLSRPEGETQTPPKLQQLVANLRKIQQKEAEVGAKGEGADCEEEVAQAKKGVQEARRAVEDQHGRIYQRGLQILNGIWRQPYSTSLCGTSGS